MELFLVDGLELGGEGSLNVMWTKSGMGIQWESIFRSLSGTEKLG